MREPQMITDPLTRAAIFLVVTISEGGEPVVRDLLGDVAGLERSVGFRVPAADLSCITAIGSAAWDRLFDGPRPAELHEFPELAGKRHTAPSTPGDILFHIRAETMDACFELAAKVADRLGSAVTIVDETVGFRYFDRRDLLGFVDGTENPTGKAAVAAALVGDEDETFAGGSYVIVQKYLHDIAGWKALTTEQQEAVIGRTKLDDFELSDKDKPIDSHVALTTVEETDGTERQILRANMPFGSIKDGEFGTYFIGYAATPSVTELMLERMFLGAGDAAHDRILEFSTAVTGSLFFAPPAGFLDDLPAPPRTRECHGTCAHTTHRRFAGHRQSEREHRMNNLYRELAPITDIAWREIEDEVTRTFKRTIAGRRVVDVSGPHGTDYSAVGRGRTTVIESPADGVQARQRIVAPLVELRVPFTLSRQEIDSIERGAQDADLDPVKDAARTIALAEDRAVFEGYPAAGITGIRAASSNVVLHVPTDSKLVPETIARALSQLRLAGVGGPYSVLLSADLYTEVSEVADHGYPIREHIRRQIDGEIIWAPAISGAFVVTTRGGDFDLQLGQDVSIGYLSHDVDTVDLYLQETLTFLVNTAEASVPLVSADASA